MAPKPALKPFTVDTVSIYARHHLKEICPDLFQDDFSKTKTNIEHLTKFTCFPKLPLEIQNEIWKHFSKLEPRRISINFDNGRAGIRTKVPALYHVSRDTRRDTLKLYGYVALEHPETPQKTLFHPQVDLLYITMAKRVSTPSPATFMEKLEASGALPHIRCIAHSLYVTDFDEHLAPLRQCANLEVVLSVREFYSLDEQQTKAGRLPRFILHDVEPYFCQYSRDLAAVTKTSKQIFMARDGGVTPFMREVCYWSLEFPSEKDSTKERSDIETPTQQEILEEEFDIDSLFEEDSVMGEWDIAIPNEQEIPEEESNIDSLFEEDSVIGEWDIAIPNEQEIPEEEYNIAIPDEQEIPEEEFDIAIPDEQEIQEEEFDIDLQYEEAAWIDLIKEVQNVYRKTEQ